MAKKTQKITIHDSEVTIVQTNEQDYISLTDSSVTSSIRFDVTIQALNSFFRCVTSTNGRKSYHPLIALRFKIAHWCS